MIEDVITGDSVLPEEMRIHVIEVVQHNEERCHGNHLLEVKVRWQGTRPPCSS